MEFKFNPGDRVKYKPSGKMGTVISQDGCHNMFYLIKFDDSINGRTYSAYYDNLEPAGKFKPGDRVRHSTGFEATVICYEDGHVKVKRDGSSPYEHYYALESCLQLIKPAKTGKPDEVVVIKRFGDKTLAYMGDKRVEVKRHKDDVHNFHKACIYVLDKLFNDNLDVTIDERKLYYTGAVVVTKTCAGYENLLPVGKIIIYNAGQTDSKIMRGAVAYMIPNVKKFDDLATLYPGVEFAEVRI